MDKITTFTEYSKRAAETQMESCKNEDYLRFGLISEVGELCAIFKRAIRGDFKLDDKRQDILLELGDICWYLDRFEALRGLPFQWRRDWGIPRNIGTANEWAYELSSSASALCEPSAYCWNCVTIISHHFGFTIWDVLTANVEKLAKRKERGLIQGSGDHRGEVNMVVESCPAYTYPLPITGITLEEGIKAMNNFQSAIHSAATGGYPDEENQTEPDAPFCGCID